ncbi:hypothetical protein LTR37_005835 [Vermiconidia calcicola]|uniref:Uncharacterized protein n=1 Tax=Vermiconidia calcicola TaxID=1690605 RepID=A0ACC3NL40_9PEZI|nr:hypothetical protein LTR37_005835 [Vermiconidia calcicola]
MSIASTLSQSIAALERIASLDPGEGESEASSSSYLHPHSYARLHQEPHDNSNEKHTFQASHLLDSEKVAYHAEASAADMGREDGFFINLTPLFNVLKFIWLIVPPFISAALAVSAMGLVAHTIWFTFHNPLLHIDHKRMVYKDEEDYSDGTLIRVRTAMWYAPEHLEMHTTWTLLATIVVCAVGSFAIGVALLRRRRRPERLQLEYEEKQPFRVFPVCASLSAFMSILTIVTTIYCRHMYGWDWSLDGPYDFRPHLPGYLTPALDGSFPAHKNRTYTSPTHYNPVQWNCVIWYNLVILKPEPFTPVRDYRIKRLCDEGVESFRLVVAIACLNAVMLGTHLYLWHRERKARARNAWTQEEKKNMESEKEEQLVRSSEDIS